MLLRRRLRTSLGRVLVSNRPVRSEQLHLEACRVELGRQRSRLPQAHQSGTYDGGIEALEQVEQQDLDTADPGQVEHDSQHQWVGADVSPGIGQVFQGSLGRGDACREAELGLDAATRCGAHARTRGPVVDQLHESGGEGLGILWWHGYPVSPSAISSPTPPTAVQTAGRPAAIASRRAIGRHSTVTELSTKTSIPRRRAGTSERLR